MENDARFQKYQLYALKKAKKITHFPVRLIVNDNAHQRNSIAHMLKYTHPTHYTIVFSGDFYDRHKNHTKEIEQIICHELAHIKEPYDHDPGFRKVAGYLGCYGKYLTAG